MAKTKRRGGSKSRKTSKRTKWDSEDYKAFLEDAREAFYFKKQDIWDKDGFIEDIDIDEMTPKQEKAFARNMKKVAALEKKMVREYGLRRGTTLGFHGPITIGQLGDHPVGYYIDRDY